MAAMTLRRLLLVLPVLAGGCATRGDYPSLLPRPVEQLSMEEPVRTDPPVPANPALRAQAAALLAEARRGDGLFAGEYARALPQVRAAGPAGSDNWIEAQAAITRVEGARRFTSAAATELDLLVTARAADPIDPSDHQALLAARDAATALVAGQERRLDALKGSLSPG